MLFLILSGFLIVASIAFISMWIATILPNVEWNIEDSNLVSLIFAMVIFMPFVAVMVKWSAHSVDLATVAFQEPIIKTHEERIVRLKSTLDKFDYPVSSSLMNADTPVSQIVNSLDKAEKELMYAKNARNLAIRDIESTRNGPMSGVIWFVGDYK